VSRVSTGFQLFERREKRVPEERILDEPIWRA